MGFKVVTMLNLRDWYYLVNDVFSFIYGFVNVVIYVV